MGEDGIEFHTVSPIPFNLHKTPRLTTPSIYSTKSLQDAASPLFRTSCQTLLREARRKFLLSPSTRRTQRNERQYSKSNGGFDESYEEQREDFGGDRGGDEMILFWLDGIPMPTMSINDNSTLGSVQTFSIWKENSPIISGRMEPGAGSVNTDILRDVTNLRRPGYLNHNSFFKKADQSARNPEQIAIEKALKDSSSPSLLSSSQGSIGGAILLQSRVAPSGTPNLFKAEIDAAAGDIVLYGSPSLIRPASGENIPVFPLVAHPHSKVDDRLGEGSRNLTRESSAINHYYDITSTLRPFTPDQNRYRATHFASALAILEGRTPRIT